MKGGSIHNRLLTEALARAFEIAGGKVLREHPVRPGQRPQSVDLFVTWGDRVIVVETEMQGRRVAAAFRKAILLGAVLLVILVPSVRVAAAARRALRRNRIHPSDSQPQILVLTLGAALQAVKRGCLPVSGSCVTGTLTLSPDRSFPLPVPTRTSNHWSDL